MEYTIITNAAFNSIEIAFDCKPSETIREALKALKFRWHGVKKYGTATAPKNRPEPLLKAKSPSARKVRRLNP